MFVPFIYDRATVVYSDGQLMVEFLLQSTSWCTVFKVVFGYIYISKQYLALVRQQPSLMLGYAFLGSYPPTVAQRLYAAGVTILASIVANC